MSNSVPPHRWQPTRLLCPWDSPGSNTGVGCHCLLQGIFLTQRLSLSFLHCRQILYLLSHQGNPLLNRVKIQQWDKLLTGSYHHALFVKGTVRRLRPLLKCVKIKKNLKGMLFSWYDPVLLNSRPSYHLRSCHMSICYVCISIPALEIGSLVPFFF